MLLLQVNQESKKENEGYSVRFFLCVESLLVISPMVWLNSIAWTVKY